ncbi:hypothetical protein Pcinc_042087 [Petrolisthes cinctipes]|uniref:Neurotransmitter-gated ion-channel ligand-binding domain-containing protein n=1 Tax=Petrolisthes cinctipes TaxID=88211 RepID=A0AAE1EH83_PETCI|nr:hypothetical protein Pcinc_042087 [Petrolisthes cinctipes]
MTRAAPAAPGCAHTLAPRPAPGWMLAWLAVAVLAPTCLANPDAKRLYDDLLSSYNRLIRPVQNNTDKITVWMKLRLSQLIDLVSTRTHLSLPHPNPSVARSYRAFRHSCTVPTVPGRHPPSPSIRWQGRPHGVMTTDCGGR